MPHRRRHSSIPPHHPPARRLSQVIAVLRLAGLLGFEAAALVVAWELTPTTGSIDWRDPLGWLERTTPEAAVLVVGRGAILAVAGWLLLTTLLATVLGIATRVHVRLRGSSAALTRMATASVRFTPGLVRHVVHGAVAVTIVAGSAGARPALAAEARTPVAVAGERLRLVPLAPVRDGRSAPPRDTPPSTAQPSPTSPSPTSPPSVPPSPVPPLGALPATAPPPTAPPPTLVLVPPVGDAPERAHVVVPGESLWSIAQDHLVARGLPTDDDAISRYWRALCDTNRGRLTSGDVDLVHPGETVELPPIA